MEQQTGFDVVYMEEASEFLKNLPEQPRNKIYYNISKVAGGIKDNDFIYT